MNTGKEGRFRRYKWYIIIIGGVIAAVVLLATFTDVLATIQESRILQPVRFLVELVILAVFILMLAKILKKLDALR